MNMQHSLIQKLMLYEFKLGHNFIEASKHICYAKVKCAVDHSTVTRWLKKFHSSYKNLNNQAKLSRFKTVDSKVNLKAMEANPASSTWRVSGKLGISLFTVVCCIYNFESGAAELCLMLPKYCKTFDSHSIRSTWFMALYESTSYF